MSEKSRFYSRKRIDKLRDHLDFNENPYFVASKRSLVNFVKNRISKTWVAALAAIEEAVKAGDLSAEKYEEIRREILNAGNQEARKCEKEIRERYNVEKLNYHIEFRNPESSTDGES